MLETAGEADRFEFKREPQAVKADVLVAAANACVIEGIAQVTILVGVEEQQDPNTGLVTGRIVGLRDLETARSTITQAGATTRPVPVGLRIIEENFGTQRPILALEVRPTHPPHFEGKGRRITRYGASTRPLTDEELLNLYLDREADAFQARFRQTAQELVHSLESVRTSLFDATSELEDKLKDVSGSLEHVRELAYDAAGASDEGRAMLESLDESIGWVHSKLDGLTNVPPTMEEAWSELRHARLMGWLNFDLYRRENKVRALRVERAIREVVARSTTHEDYQINLAELGAWRRMPDSKREPAVKRWEKWAANLRSAALDTPEPWIPKTWDEMRAERMTTYREENLLDPPKRGRRRRQASTPSRRGRR
jgi:predicted HTH transcriptional regulator